MEVSGPEDDPFLAQLHRVQCPVCQQTMPAAHINSHLDRCLLLHPAGQAEPAAGPPRAKRRRPSESSALKQPATPTAAESSEGEAEEPDDGGETESRESYDAPPTPSGARLIPDFPVARPGSPARKGAGKRPAAAAAAGSASPRSWDEAEAPEEEEAVGDADGDADADGDGEDDAGRWDADAAAAAAFGAPGGRPHARAPAAEEVRQMLEGKPLADKMRPDSLQDYVGQGRAVGPETLLRSLLEANELPSLILWGPPGCGKTTLAHIIANHSKKHSIRFVTLSATNAKTTDVRDVIKQAQNEKSFFKRKTILFIDEIHRFNKSQQDTFLPHVECGTITLIGATTENPSFQVNAALLSRCRVIVLEKLPVEAVVAVLMRAINTLGIHVLDSSRPADPLSHGSNSSSENNSTQSCTSRERSTAVQGNGRMETARVASGLQLSPGNAPRCQKEPGSDRPQLRPRGRASGDSAVLLGQKRPQGTFLNSHKVIINVIHDRHYLNLILYSRHAWHLKYDQYVFVE